VKPTERLALAKRPDATQCVACGGSGARSTGGTCGACKGGGSILPQHSSETVEHYTPLYIVDAARRVLGGIDLDPASCAMAQDLIKAEVWYGENSSDGEDGLEEPWGGRVFLNPPGGRVSEKGLGTSSNAALWWAKLASEWQAGEVEAAIFVGFTLEILRSAQALDVPQPLDFPICVPKSRIKFDTPVYSDQGEPYQREASSSPTHANVIVYLPPRVPGTSVPGSVAGFLGVFGEIGRCRE